MSTTNTNETSAIAPAITTQPEGLPPGGASELPGKLMNYEPPPTTDSGTSGTPR